MPTEWRDLFLTNREPPAAEPEPEQVAEEEEEADGAGGIFGRRKKKKKAGFFTKVRENMSKTREALHTEIVETLSTPLTAETWERLEEALIYADCGATTTAKVVGQLEQEAASGKVEGAEQLQERLAELLAEIAQTGTPTIDLRHTPTVIMAVGVNGTGKTTTIGKLAWHIQRELGLNVVMGAADTYRAAAVEQLEKWAERAGCQIVTGPEGSDPGSVAFETVRQGIESGADVVIVDTAGRLHNNDELMAELAKVKKVIAKQIEGAPHETLLTIDATTGQNGTRQAKLFSEIVDVDGIVLTKLDGTAKGGIALAIAGELGIPVKLVGVGEALEDLQPFDALDFTQALIAP